MHPDSVVYATIHRIQIVLYMRQSIAYTVATLRVGLPCIDTPTLLFDPPSLLAYPIFDPLTFFVFDPPSFFLVKQCSVFTH